MLQIYRVQNMLTYPQIDPIAFHIGPVAVHWYGLMYLLAFASCWSLLEWRLRTSPRGFTSQQLSDIVFYVALGVILGGRIGYVLFYEFPLFMAHPLFILEIWKGGMSFHGGLIGVLVAMGIYTYQIKKPFFAVSDFVAPVVPLGLGLGRLGNFINGELWGRVTDVPWALVFPGAGELPRHPSQLYEFFLEGVCLFLILWIYSRKPRACGAVSGLFLMLYAIARFSVEFFREPDQQIGFIAWGWLTKGQLLCLPMLVAGIIIFLWSKKKVI